MSTAIIYWSGTGNTEAMANAIAKGIGAEAEVFSVDNVDSSVVGKYEKLAFGCPSMGAEVLEEESFEPFFSAIEGSLGGKKVALFGSYGWGDGEWMRDWQVRVNATGASLFEEGFIQQEAPDEGACEEFGSKFDAF